MPRDADALIRARLLRAFDDVAARAAAAAPGLGTPRHRRRGLAPVGAALALAAATGTAGAVLVHGHLSHTPAGLAHPVPHSTATPTPTPAPTPAPLPHVAFPAVAADLSGGILVFGGSTGQGANGFAIDSNQFWIWHESGWTRLHPATLPPARQGAAMVADPAHGDVLLYGGSDMSQNTDFTDTWTWDGTAWTQHHPRHNPGGLNALVAYDPVHREVVLVDTGEAWTWDGSDWTEHTNLPVPDIYGPSELAWDPATRSVILADIASVPGQMNGAGVELTWSWRGTRWVELHPPAQADVNRDFRNSAYGVTDPSGGVLVLIPQSGKLGPAAPVMRRWNGHSWATVSAGNGPAYVAGAVVTSDGRLLVVDLDGGSVADPTVREWTGGHWVPLG